MKGNKWSLVLSLLGVAGVGVTSWLSVRCSKKAEKETEKKKKIIAYVPAIASGIITSGSILLSHHISRKEIVALTATCGYLAANRDKIEQKVREEFGEEKLKEFKKEVTEDISKERQQEDKFYQDVTIEDSGYGHVHFVEYYLGREFYCSYERVEWAEKELNRRFHNGEYVCMNDFYELVNIRKTKAGWEFGWPASKDFYDYDIDTPIIFDNILGEDEYGEELWMIDIRTSPMDCWMEV